MPTSDSQSNRLELLYRLSQAFNSSLDLDEVLNRVMDEVVSVTQAERGFVMLYGSDGRLLFRAARGMDQQTIDEPRFQISRSVVERVAREGQPILTSDAQLDDRFSSRRSVVLLGLRSLLCVPLKVKEKNLGAIYVDNRLQAGIFTQADMDLLSAIASNAAIAIENARLYQVAVEQGRIEKELQMARRMQVGLLPRQAPQVPGWEFAARWLPAREVAGDYYDFMLREDGQIGLVIADVTDKGMPAALFMAFTRTIIRASVDRADSPAQGISHANQLICAESTDGFFVTLFYSLVDPASGKITYVNAGHNPPYLCQRDPATGQPKITSLTRTGIPLGVETAVAFEERSVMLQPGDFILLYTDGATDAIDSDDEPYGTERLLQVVKSHCRASAKDMLDVLENSVHAYTGNQTPFDDITLMIVKRL